MIAGRALAVEMHGRWLEADCYLNMEFLKDHTKEMMRPGSLMAGGAAAPDSCGRAAAPPP